MTSFGYDILGFGVGGGPLYTSQVFTSSGTYTPSDGVTSALFMVFGARGSQPSSGNVADAGGGGGYAEKYVSSLSSSYSVTLNTASTSSAGGATVISSGNNNRTGGYGSGGDFTASGGTGGGGSNYNIDARGGTAAGGSRCGTGGSGGNSDGSNPGTSGAIGNSGNETSGVFDLSPYGITFAYTRGTSGVPVLNNSVTDEEVTLASHCNTAAGNSNTNSGIPGWSGVPSGYAGTALIIEFF
tara:strand:- start:61 stop:783 length:723 start_codon:yes stop_codon:yes gene_type:complete